MTENFNELSVIGVAMDEEDRVVQGVVAFELELEDGKTITGRLHDVLYVPELAYNLLSISKVAKCGKSRFLQISLSDH